MSPSAQPIARLSHLHRSDGSATFSQNGYTVIGAVNGPLEVQRRDELPEEAAVDVVVRPATGVGGTRERHLESILQSTLRQIILIHNFPRTLIQITLQITSTPENNNAGSKVVQATSNLPILPALIQTAVLALLSASNSLSVSLSSVFLALNSEGSSQTIIHNPTILQSQSASSVHVLAFTSLGDLLVAESEGSFTMNEWESVYDAGKAMCCEQWEPNGDQTLQDEAKSGSLMTFLKSTLEAKVADDLHWKD